VGSILDVLIVVAVVGYFAWALKRGGGGGWGGWDPRVGSATRSGARSLRSQWVFQRSGHPTPASAPPDRTRHRVSPFRASAGTGP